MITVVAIADNDMLLSVYFTIVINEFVSIMQFIKLDSKQDHKVDIWVLLQHDFIKDLQYAGPCMSCITVGKEI